MAKYYFVTTLLPALKIGEPPDIGSRELDFILKMNLTEEDFKQITVLRRLVDIENLRFMWQGKDILPSGNFDEKEIEENILHGEKYPKYIFDYMEKYTDNTTRLNNFPELLRAFFQNEIIGKTGFVKDYLNFEREWRLILTAMRAKSLGRSIATEMQFEDPEDPFVQSILEQADMKTFTPPEQYASLRTIYETKKEKPLDLALQFSEWRFNYIEKMKGWHTFDIKNVLTYIVQLEIVEEWFELDKKKGLEMIEKISTAIDTK